MTGVALGFGLVLTATAALADIQIGVAGPMTGQYAAFGEQLKRGAEMAVADINAAGGVNGEKLVLNVGDDACDPKQAVAVANDMASKKVVFVAGHFCSGSSIPASAVYAEENIVQISPASTNPKFTDERPGKGVFRVCRPRRCPGHRCRQLPRQELRRQEHRHPRRQDPLWQRPGR